MSLTGGPLGSTSSYLGREAELDRLQLHLETAAQGNGGLVLLRGPGGMGTTRTAHEVAARADRSGMLVLWGSCREDGSDRPFGALAEALEEYGSGLEPADLAAQLRAAAPVLTRLAPGLRLNLAELTPAAPLDAASERLRLHIAVRDWLSRAAEAHPLLLVLDNMQWADEDTLLLLDFLTDRASNVPVLILAAEVQLPMPPEAVDQRTPGSQRRLDQIAGDVIELSGLDEGATAAIVAPLANEPIGRSTLNLLQEVTGGEPLWARELYRHLQEENRLEADGGSAGRGLPAAADLPETFEQLVAWRMSRLAPEVRGALTALAAFPTGAEPALLAEVAGLPRGRLVDYLETGVARAICRAEAGGTSYVIGHDRLRLALLASIPGEQRARLQRRVAQALEADLGEQAREHAGRLLHHYRLSVPLEGAERGLRHGLVAAEQARAAYAFHRQARCLEQSLQLVADGPPEIATDLQERLARALAEAGLGDQALDAAATVLRARRGLNRPMGETLDQLAGSLRVLRGEGIGGAEQDALERVRRECLEYSARATPLTRARLELLAEHWQLSEVASVKTLTWSTVPSAATRPLREHGDESDLAELLLAQQPRQRDESARAAGYARSWRGPAVVLRAMRSVTTDLLTRHGLFPEAASWAGLYLSTAQRYGAPRDELIALILLSRGQALLGVLEGAVETLHLARERHRDVPADDGLDNELLLTNLVLAHYRDGDWRELAQRLESARERPSPQGLMLAAESCLAAARVGDEQAARQLLPDVFDACAAQPPFTYYRDSALLSALAAAWELGAAEHSARGRQLLELAASAGVGGQPAGTLRLARARMYGLATDVDEAVALLAEERQALEAAGLRPLAAIALHDEALILAASGSRRLAEAPPLLEQAAARFEALGMSGWLARARALLDRGIEAALRPGGRLHFTYPLGLSRREADLVRLVSSGTSVDIAAEALGIDSAAAERHLQSALGKLGVGPDELARAARRHGLGGGI